MPGVSPEDLESSPGFLDAATTNTTDDYLLAYDDSANTLRPQTYAELAKAVAKARPGGLTTTQQILTVGSGTYNRPTNCTAIRVQIQAAGAGGGGADGGSSQAGCGGGGGSGGYVEKFYASPASSYTYTVGAKGAGGVAGNNAGSNGADSTFDNAGTVITAKGGSGGSSMAAGTSVAVTAGGPGGAASTNGDFASGGGGGTSGIRLSGTVTTGGAGGASFFGQGGLGRLNAAGDAALAPGSGGGGAGSTTTTDTAGGAGADGLIIVTEFYG